MGRFDTMRDKEFIELRNKFLLGLFIAIIFIVPIFIFIKNKLYITDPDIIKGIDKKNNMIILITNEDCSYCSNVRKELDNLNVNYYLLNSDRERSYETILMKLNLTDSDIIYPSLVYIEEGEVVSTLVDIKDIKDVDTYLENYNLLK